jgi:hypothetical protein
MVKMHRISIFIAVCLVLWLSYMSVASAAVNPRPAAARVGNCPVFPTDNPWNRDVSADPVHPNSDAMISYINGGGNALGFAFGNWPENGIPYNLVPGTQPKVPVTFGAWANQSDPGPYPIPDNPLIEGANIVFGDRHMIVVDGDNCMLYELHNAYNNGTGWTAESGAIFNLRSNQMRPEGWTSADAAGLPIFPGLIRYDEVATGSITHALRFVVAGYLSQAEYVFPARHYQGRNTNVDAPPMGTRVRLKADFNLSGYTGQARVILEALKRYGMILADESDKSWVVWGMSSINWDRQNLELLRTVPGSAFEVVLPQYPEPVQTAASATQLKLQYHTADTNATDNILQPVFNIVNTGSGYGVLSELKFRYYFTNEGGNTLQVVCVYAPMGCDTLKLTIVKLPAPLDRANTYVEIAFNSRAGTIFPGQQTDSIQIRINKMDWSNFTESNDYSYNGSLTAFGDWRRITMYRNDQLIWGIEPLPLNITSTPTNTRVPTRTSTPTRVSTGTATSSIPTNTPGAATPTRTNTPVAVTATRTALPTSTRTATFISTPTDSVRTAIDLQYLGAPNATDNQMQSHLNLINSGTTTVAYNSIKVRYWFTPDSTSAAVFRCDWAPMNCANVTGTVVQMPTALPGAEYYLEVGFTAAAGSLAPGTQSGTIQISMHKADWSNFSEADDYSYDSTRTTIDYWQKIAVYNGSTKVWGFEPAAPSTTVAPTRTATRTNTPVPVTITSTSTPLPTRTNTAVPTTVPTTVPTRTNTAISPTATFTATNTVTRIPSNTLVPPSATFTFTPTNTALPTRTATRTPSNTSVPPSATFIPTNTALPTNTATRTPTATFTATNTIVATSIATRTATATRTSTATATFTATNTLLPSNTALPTNTSTRVPTATFTATRTSTAVPTSTPTAILTLTATNAIRTDIDLQYLGSPNATDNQMQSHLNLINTGTTTVQYSDIKIRYWFTPDSTSPAIFRCDWAPMACANVTGVIVKMPTALPGAEYYLEIGFTTAAGSLAPGAQSSTIQISMRKSDWSNFNETDDYSYDATRTVLGLWDKIAVYHAGSNVSGIEP